MRSTVALCSFLLLQTHCGSGAGADGATGDGATLEVGADVSNDSAMIHPDAVDVAIGADVPSSPDAGCAVVAPVCPAPPAGATLCGGGAIDVSAATTACNAVDPAMDLGVGAMKNCSAFTLVHGTYSVYCDAAQVYFWVDFDMVTSTDVNPCDISVPLPDGGVAMGSDPTLAWDAQINSIVYARYGSGSGVSGGMLIGVHSDSSEMQLPRGASAWQGAIAFAGIGTATGASGDTVTGALYFEANPVDCEDVQTAQGSIIAAAPVSWHVP